MKSDIRGDPISTYARVTQRTQTDARRKITRSVRTYLMDRPLEDRVSKRKSQGDKAHVVVLEVESFVTCSNVSSRGQFYEVLSAGMVCKYNTCNPFSNSFQHISNCYV